MATRRIIIDCDPGTDDALALLLAFASPDELAVLGVTTVAGNVPLPLTSANARRICELAGRADVPVYAGCARPILRPLITAEHIHGDNGLDGVELPAPTMKLADGHAVDFIIDTVLGSADPVTLCPTGPLTNIALAIVKQPAIVERLEGIVLMGGAVGAGNVTPSAEFNIHVDPHAAAVVFGAGAPVTMLGLDVTHQALVTPQRRAAIAAIGTRVSDKVSGLLAAYDRADIERFGEAGSPLHDPCVIAYLLRPELFRGREAHVVVETASAESVGRTIVDLFGALGRPANATVIDSIDADGFFAMLTERLARLPVSGTS